LSKSFEYAVLTQVLQWMRFVSFRSSLKKPGGQAAASHATDTRFASVVSLVVSSPLSIVRFVALSNVVMFAIPDGVDDDGVTVSFTVSTTVPPSAISPDPVVITSVFVPADQAPVAVTVDGVENVMTGVLGMLQPTLGSTTVISPPASIPPAVLNASMLSVVTAAFVAAAAQRKLPPSLPADMLA
jgi:hypothetical protein